MITIPLGQLSRQDIDDLIDYTVRESKVIEYKTTLPAGNDDSKKEFLADISSFANTIGGHLLYGIEAKDGVPTAAPGLAIHNLDQEIQRLDNIISTGLKPRIRYTMTPIEAANKQPVIAIHVERSHNSPHRVTFAGHDKFYARNSQGKYPMDVNELRAAFLASSTAATAITAFRQERINRIMNNNNLISVTTTGALLVMHLLPLEAFTTSMEYNVQPLLQPPLSLLPITYRGAMPRINYHGIMQYSVDPQPCQSYVQAFRTGGIEVFDATILTSPRSTEHLMPAAYETQLHTYVPQCLKALYQTGAGDPFILLLSLLNVKGKTIAINIAGTNPDTITEEHLLLPDVLITDNTLTSIDRALKSTFDLVWNACGLRQSPFFDQSGQWRNN